MTAPKDNDYQRAAAEGESIPRPPDAPPPPPPLVSADDALRAMIERWEKGPEPSFSTGLSQLDAVLSGGLRRKSFVTMTGAAKSGKTSLFDQVTFDAVNLAEGRAFGLVLSTEMTTDETIARWIALSIFRARLAQRTPDPLGFAGFGKIQTGEAWQHETTRTAVRLAAESMRGTLARLSVERLPPMSSVATVEERIKRARERWPDAVPIVFLDPLQRLRAAPVLGSNVDRINEDETARVSLVATQVFDLAEREGLIVLAACDTTKAGAVGASSATGTRGSYVLNHAATTVLGFHRSADETDAAPWEERFQGLAKRLAKEDGAAEGESPESLAPWIAARVPAQLWEHPDAAQLGRRAVYLECSGNRAGPAKPCAFGSVPGAACFAEARSESESTLDAFRRGAKNEPGGAPKKKAKFEGRR